jgi:ABC-type antimicrobial peptide transport system permease subunit
VRDLTRLVVGAGIAQALAGAAIGLAGAIGVARLIAAAYPGIRTDNVAVFVAAVAVLVSVAVATCWWPARRASRVDAMAVLRAE